MDQADEELTEDAAVRRNAGATRLLSVSFCQKRTGLAAPEGISTVTLLFGSISIGGGSCLLRTQGQAWTVLARLLWMT